MTGVSIDLAAWSVHCFSPNARRTPHSIVAMDNNSSVLAAARSWIDLDQLRERGMEIRASQYRLLEDYGLLERDGGQVRSTFPMLTADELASLRPAVARIADDLAAGSIGMIDGIHSQLAEGGYQRSLWAVVFGHALDGLVWDRLRDLDLLPPVELTVEHPFWRGALWALETPYAGSAGTNFIRSDGATVIVCWTDAVARRIGALMRDPSSTALASWLPTRDVSATPAPEGVAHGELVDGSGAPTFPLVAPGDALDLLCGSLADRVTGELLDRLLPEIRTRFPTMAERTRTVIASHEFIWALTDALVARGTTEVPTAAATGRGPLDELVVGVLTPRG